MKLMNTNSQDRDKQNEIGELKAQFLRPFLAIKSPLKIMKNAFISTEKLFSF